MSSVPAETRTISNLGFENVVIIHWQYTTNLNPHITLDVLFWTPVTSVLEMWAYVCVWKREIPHELHLFQLHQLELEWFSALLLFTSGNLARQLWNDCDYHDNSIGLFMNFLCEGLAGQKITPHNLPQWEHGTSRKVLIQDVDSRKPTALIGAEEQEHPHSRGDIPGSSTAGMHR